MSNGPRIRDVWAPNLETEMRTIREVIEVYPYVAMDTEFPGVVARPIGNFKQSSDYHYQTMRCNVDLLKIIQVGLTFTDENGIAPPDCSTWQFNFRFSLNEDMYLPESVEALEKSGIDFRRHEDQGILPNDFAELMITSGLVLAPDVKFLSFHSGYDFGYFVKLLTNESLPTSEDAFFDILRVWFPTVYDTKFMARGTDITQSSLGEIAERLEIVRIDNTHQAGSDSHLTSSIFFKMRDLYFGTSFDDGEYNGKLYGFGQTFSLSNGLPDPSRGGATIAERDDRTVMRELHNQTPGSGIMSHAQAMGMPMGTGGLPAPMPSTTYGPMGTNGPYMRAGLVGR